VDCTLDRHLLDGYLDGELGFERALEVEAHLASCHGCSAEVENWKSVRTAIQRSDLYHRAPASLEEKIRKLAPQSERTQSLPWAQRWFWAGGGAAFATAILVFAFLATYRPHPPFDQAIDQDIVESHIRSLMADHLMDVVSTDRHTVKPWFDGRVEFAPPVQDFADQGFPLAGGRLDYLEHRKVAVLAYHRALHVINLYVWPAADAGSSNVVTGTLEGYNVLSWKKNGFEFRAVSDLNAAELHDFSKLVSP
jgi:anti-sigma factor RsiW